MKRIGFILLLLIAVSITSFAGKKKDKANKQVSLFGVTVSLVDSTAFITEIQTVDSLLTNKDGFIDNEEEYTRQLKLYLDKVLNVKEHVCAIYYSDDMKKLVKEYKEVNNRIRNKEKRTVSEIDIDDFKFTLYKAEDEE